MATRRRREGEGRDGIRTGCADCECERADEASAWRGRVRRGIIRWNKDGCGAAWAQYYTGGARWMRGLFVCNVTDDG